MTYWSPCISFFFAIRATIRIDEHLLAAVEKRAAETGRTLTWVIEDAVRESLARRAPGLRRSPIRLKTVVGNGVQAGVALDDTARLEELMRS